jgi:cytochrome c oxidase subunit 2
VTLEDGTTVTADREYLERAITDPSSEIVDGFKPIMPMVPLDDAQLDQVIAYIEALG